MSKYMQNMISDVECMLYPMFFPTHMPLITLKLSNPNGQSKTNKYWIIASLLLQNTWESFLGKKI